MCVLCAKREIEMDLICVVCVKRETVRLLCLCVLLIHVSALVLINMGFSVQSYNIISLQIQGTEAFCPRAYIAIAFDFQLIILVTK